MHTPISLLCLPYASAMTYMRWRHLLPSWVRVVPLELPGRGTRMREPACEDFMQLTSRLCSDYAHMLSGRYALFGYSTGALLAYGMARHVHANSCCWVCWSAPAGRLRAATPSNVPRPIATSH